MRIITKTVVLRAGAAVLAAPALTGCSVTFHTGAHSADGAPPDAASDASTREFSLPDFGITSNYPTNLILTDKVTAATGAGTPSSTKALALDRKNMILVERYPLRASIGHHNLDLVRPELDATMARLDPNAGPGVRLAGGELPSLEYQVAAPNGTRSRFLVFFDGPTEYTINCQYTEERRTEIATACETARSTLRRA